MSRRAGSPFQPPHAQTGLERGDTAIVGTGVDAGAVIVTEFGADCL